MLIERLTRRDIVSEGSVTRLVVTNLDGLVLINIVRIERDDR